MPVRPRQNGRRRTAGITGIRRIRRIDPFEAALESAPIDDEPYTPEQRAAAAVAWEEYLRGEAEPWEAVRTELVDDCAARV